MAEDREEITRKRLEGRGWISTTLALNELTTPRGRHSSGNYRSSRGRLPHSSRTRN